MEASLTQFHSFELTSLQPAREAFEPLIEVGAPARKPLIRRLGQLQSRRDVSEPPRTGQTMRLEQAGAIRVFTDVRSGKSMDRPGLAGLLAYSRNGDTLAVVRLYRLGRSLAELLSIVEQLKGRGVALLSLEEKIETSSAAGELVFHVFGAIAHFERRLIAERTKDGIAAARARGKVPGRQPVDADKVQAALKLVQAGLSPTKAASQLGLGRSTVYREVAASGISRSA